jgi:hypothetical protein
MTNEMAVDTLPDPGLAQLTTKIRTTRGPDPATFPSNLAFALARAMRVRYHQQMKNLLAGKCRLLK